MKKYHIVTFGCAQNVADSERVAAAFAGRGYISVDSWKKADVVVINTCMVRQMAEDRVYGLVLNIVKHFQEKSRPKIILTGCMVGLTVRDKSDKIMARLRERMPEVDEFLPIEEVGFNLEPARNNKEMALVPISNGCNNFCTFCVVPFTRGREVSRPWEEIMAECQKLRDKGYKSVMLLGQNVNSYGSDLIRESRISNLESRKKITKDKKQNSKILNSNQDSRFLIQDSVVKPVMVKHLGRYRIPTLFPQLLDAVAKMGFENVNFMSSNPWDFSDELIEVISKNKNITRTIHLPVQSGDDEVLKRMNRWYTAADYVGLISKIKNQISKIKFTTDIIVGFPGETEAQFKNTVKLCKTVGFDKAYISIYSSRPLTAATTAFPDDVPHAVKKERWEVLEKMINKKSRY